MKIFIIIVAIILVLIMWFVSTYNKLVSARMKVRESFSTVDIYLKKRYDLVPNLLESVKGYMGYENEVLSKIVELRGKAVSGSSTEERMEHEKEMSNAINKLLVVSESYPELKANEQFLDLQQQLKSIENDLEKARRYYNGTVTNLNTMVNMMPTNIIANMFNIKEEAFFEIEKGEGENIKVEF